MFVYAKVDGTIIWSSVRANHKQGRVKANIILAVIGDGGSYYEISKGVVDFLDREVKPEYPNFYIAKADVVEGTPSVEPDPPVEPPPLPYEGERVTDSEAAIALAIVLKWYKQ